MEKSSPPPAPRRPCPKCGVPVEPGHSFCQICGAKIYVPPTCPECGAQFIMPVKFCEVCGAPMGPAGSAERSRPAEDEPDIPEEDHHEIPAPAPRVVTAKSRVQRRYPDTVPEEPPEDDWETSGEVLDDRLQQGRDRRPETIPEAHPPEEDIPEEMPEEIPVDDDLPEELPEEKPAPPRRPAGRAEKNLQAERGPLPRLPPDPDIRRPAPAPGPKVPKKTLMIAGAVILLLIIAAAAYTIGMPLLKGRAGPAPAVVAAPAPVPTEVIASPPPTAVSAPPPAVKTPAPTPTAPVNPLETLATEVFPRNQEVYFHYQKDPVTSQITIFCDGGPGVNAMRSADVRVTHYDGKVLTATLVPSQGINEVNLDGTRDADRLEVLANMHSGQTVRVVDELLSYKARAGT